MKRIIRVSESNLVKLIQKVLVEEKHTNPKKLNEDSSYLGGYGAAYGSDTMGVGAAKQKEKQQRLQNIANMKKQALTNKGMVTAGGVPMRWTDYIAKYNITPEEVTASEQLNVTTDANLKTQQERYNNIVGIQNSVDNNGIIQSGNMKGKTWSEYLQKYKITPDEINKANDYVKTNPSDVVKTIPKAVVKTPVNTKPAVARDYTAMLAEI